LREREICSGGSAAKREGIQHTKNFTHTVLTICCTFILLLSGATLIFYDYLRLPGFSSAAALDLPQGHSAALVSSRRSEQIAAVSGGSSYKLQLSAGFLPLKQVTVTDSEPTYAALGGQAIGILLSSGGATVVGYAAIGTEAGESLFPAREAGIQVGDFITAINGAPIHSNTELAAAVEAAGSSGKPCLVEYRRGNSELAVQIEPLFCAESDSWRIGLYVRDNTAGIGTMTFCETDGLNYGALGHEVSELNRSDTEDSGCIVRAAIRGLKSGAKGAPGEKLGSFVGTEALGDIRKNTRYGIYGRLDEAAFGSYFDTVLPLAEAAEVQTGPATIYTVLEDEQVEEFDIRIVKLMEGYRLSGKGMIVEVTDPELLAATGGIIQGMSGSPIVQNGKIVGAVTHVFINDPTRGYGIFAEWMLDTALEE